MLHPRSEEDEWVSELEGEGHSCKGVWEHSAPENLSLKTYKTYFLRKDIVFVSDS